MKLRTRLTIIYTVASALLVTAISIVVITALRAGLTGNLDASLRARASDVKAQLGDGRDAPIAVEAVNGIVVQILGSRGQVLDGSDAVGGRPLASPAQVRSVQRGDVVADRTVDEAGGSRQIRMLLSETSSGRIVVVAADLAIVDDPVRRTEGLLAGVSAVLVGAAGFGSWLQARAALRPVDRMRVEAQAMTISGARHGIAVPGNGDELSRLAATFNDLLRRLHSALERERAFAADAGHELRTPLTVLQGELELGMRAGRTSDQLRSTVATAQRQANRLVRLAEGLLQLVNVEQLTYSRFEVRRLLRECAEQCAHEAVARQVSVRVAEDSPLMAVGEVTALQRTFVNLISNAVRYAPEGSVVEVAAGLDGDGWRVAVRDRGVGFPPEFLPRAFDRFSQAAPHERRDHGGAGLGLAIVAAVMAAHGGRATAVNVPDGGAEVSVFWPDHRVTRS